LEKRKGIRSLIPTGTLSEREETIQEVPITELAPSPYQPRAKVDERRLSELAESIKAHGILQPLILRRSGRGYQVIAGERRLRAAMLAGLARVPAVVREAKDHEMLELALVENLQREDINPMEAAEAYRRLMDEFGLTQEQVARRVGKSRAAVGNAVRLLKLPQPVKTRLADGTLTEGHARALQALEGEAAILKALIVVTRRALSVRQTEEMVRRSLAEPKAKAKKAAASAETRSLEDRLRRSLGTKVNLFRSRRGGKVVIHFFSDEEFDAIYRRLVGRD
jgi:ParB family chromosome partitioning protein